MNSLSKYDLGNKTSSDHFAIEVFTILKYIFKRTRLHIISEINYIDALKKYDLNYLCTF